MKKCDNCPQRNPNLKFCLSEQIKQFDFEELQNDLLEAIKLFYEKDVDLLKRGANEVCITSHIFHYFALLYEKKYSMYHIDPEYNKNGRQAKYYAPKQYAIPDLIIHRRNCNKYNLLYVEYKVNCSACSESDFRKIVDFVSSDIAVSHSGVAVPYRYKYGVAILINPCRVKFSWYRTDDKNSFAENVYRTDSWERV